METPDQIREKLERFSSQLKALTFPESPISIDLAQFVAAALDSYSSGEAKTLDAAFNLAPRRGRPANPERHREIARQILPMKRAGKSWVEIMDDLSMAGCDVNDEREVRRIFEEFYPGVASEDLTERLNKSDQDFYGGG